MDELIIELTNACNRNCLHCLRNKADPPEFLPLTIARKVLPQARALDFRNICLTGGEVVLYPDLEDFLSLVVDHGFGFTLVTNGHRFRELLLPLLTAPENREKLKGVCFSLDGSKPETHDALRGPGSFREVIEAVGLCQLKGIPFSFKSVITNFNKEELTELALLGATLGAQDLGFIHPYPTPRFLMEEAIPSPAELSRTIRWINDSLAKSLKPRINIEGWAPWTTLTKCTTLFRTVNLDFQGNLILCCNLSHVEEGKPSVFGGEWVADLKEVPLREGLIRHFHGVAKLMEARLRDVDRFGDVILNTICCYWCFIHFDKFGWLKGFPESPWAAGVLNEESSHTCF
jgi:sulfatase maturation enzyme AslB (radical SAM superfamily)